MFKFNFFILFILMILLDLLYANNEKIDIKKDIEKIFLREKIVKIAISYLGKPYLYGKQNMKSGFDCSGFTQLVYSKAKIKIPRTVIQQFSNAIRYKLSIKKGDLIFFTMKLNGIPDHVGIYIGNNEFIHSPSFGKYVKIDTLKKSYWKIRFICAGAYIY